MRVSEASDRILVRNTPGCLWLFGSVFIASGSFVLASLLGGAMPEIWGESVATLAVFAIGAAHLAGGLFVIHQAPSVSASFDLLRNRLTYTRRGLFRREARDLLCTDVGGVELEEGRDSDGDPVFNIMLRLRSGEQLELVSFVQGRDWAEKRASRLRDRLMARGILPPDAAAALLADKRQADERPPTDVAALES